MNVSQTKKMIPQRSPRLTYGNSSAAVAVILALTFAWSILGPTASSWAADRIVLRSLKIISDRTVVSFDEDGVRLDNGTIITWDEIERGSVAEAKQKEFDSLLKQLGEPLYRIRQRLKTGDYEGLLEFAEAVYPRYVSRRSPTAYMVFQGLMWSRLAAGKREGAVEPYLRAYEYLRATRSQGDLPGDRRLRFDGRTALSPTLPPVWFDDKAASKAMPGVQDAIRAMKQPWPTGVWVYYAALAAKAGDADVAKKFLGYIKDDHDETAQWRDIIKAQLELSTGRSGSSVARLESMVTQTIPKSQDYRGADPKPAAIYWLGVSKIASDDARTREAGVLQLCYLPAIYGKDYAELAGAGLYQSMVALDQLNDTKGSLAVRKELLVRYGHTVYGSKVKSESKLSKDP